MNESVPMLTARAVQRYLDRGMDQQSAINAAVADARKGVTPVAFKVQAPLTERGDVPTTQPRAKSRDLEHAEQCLLFAHIRSLEPEIFILKLVHAVPNGGARSKRTAGRLWAEGVRRGPPDVYLDVARQGFHGFRLEMKAPGNEARTSDEQREWIDEIRREGYFVTVEDTWESAWNALVWYLGLDSDYLQPMRGDE